MIKADPLPVVDGFYAAAAGCGTWEDALTALKQSLGFSGAAIRIFDNNGRTIERIWDGLDERAFPQYEAHYASLDPSEKYMREHPDTRGVYTYLTMSEAEIDRSEYLTWKMREMGACYALSARTRPGIPFRARVPLHRTRSIGHPTADEIGLYLQIFDHIERALLFAWRLDAAPLSAPVADSLLEAKPHGVILLDRFGRVLFANRAAQKMAERNDGFTLSRDTIATLRHSDNGVLQRLIMSAVQPDIARSLSRGGAMRLPRPTGQRDYAILVTPLPARSGPFAQLAPAVCVTIADPAAPTPLSALRDLYGLTHAELRLAEHLAQGQTPKEAATLLGIAMPTVRAQLSALLRKTETRRQAELIRLIQTIASAGPGEASR